MATSALFDVIDGLVSVFTTQLATDNLSSVVVFDGPDIRQPSTLECVTVGSDDEIRGDFRSGREEQSWATIGATKKDVRGQVLCTIHAQSGSMDVRTRRERAQTILSSCETALRNDVDLTAGSIYFTGLDSIDLRQSATTDGTVVSISFSVSYRGRI